ncbi:glycosyltransferase family 2 protein [Pedobacter boryungensis]|uniref:Glycosyltransferase n=1 Tax=Pedobacter boryungensis TaxID=869962 RepID=A0ABX2D857_9SPHI|nr:glycosyltransferase family 2 protein [Pedobacter boryungensis]NQX30192.1 glycosyltransferase [Pedobacter boryungensis]
MNLLYYLENLSLKVSLITVVYNGEKYIEDCVKSVISQKYNDIEYIVIDGESTDSTLAILEKHKSNIDIFVSEKDKGMYDALNKGIILATGDIIGILNADDMLANTDVISNIVSCFKQTSSDAVYGNLNYISPDSNQIVRKWKSKQFTKKDIELGWMPAHPTLYIKKELFNRLGHYSLNFGTAADYELMLRYLYRFQINAVFLNQLIVKMRTGGMSNASFRHRYHALINDYKAIKANKVSFPLITILLKKMSKIRQYLH